VDIEQATLDRPPSLTDAVVAHIRDGIVRGAYGPGQALTEAQLADELGTSRGTVREALRVLGGLGLVERTAHRGAAVSRLTPRRAEEIYTLRASLESLAAQLAVERGHIDQDALAVLGGLVDVIESAARRGDLPGMVHADIDFHRALSAYSGHDLLMEHLDAIQVHSRRLLFYSDLYQPEPDLVVRRHRYLLGVLATGDSYQVAIAVDEHITGPGRDIVDEMRAREHDQEARRGEDA
jgi:DNA-binding GntR family transcriptional regulator